MGLLRRQLQAPGLCRFDDCNNSDRSSRRPIKTNEAPYQTFGQRTLEGTLGYKELKCVHFWLSLLSECLSCYLYVLIVCSTRISWTGAIIGHEPNLIAMSLSSGIAMMLLVFTFQSVHVNPALTISFLLTGRIPLVRAICYLLVHCFGAIAAAAFLYSVSVEGHAGALGLDKPHDVLLWWQVLIVEIVISFVVTITTYATCNSSSYASARKFTLEQLGQTTDLFSLSTYDNSSAQNHPRRSVVAPIVPHLFSTSVTLQDNARGLNSDLMNVTDSTDQATVTNKPYLIGNHYNQVYDEYNSVMLDLDRVVDRKDELNDQFSNTTQMNLRSPYENDVLNPKQISHQALNQGPQLMHQINNRTFAGRPNGGMYNPKSNFDAISTNHMKQRNLITDPSRVDEFNDARLPTVAGDNGYSNCTSSNNAASSSSTETKDASACTSKMRNPDFSNMRVNNSQVSASLLGPYHGAGNDYEYEYDNHRIYATQQLKSDISEPHISIEEVMKAECQLLAPNGFSIQVTKGQAFIIGLAYTLTSLSGIPASGASLNPARSFGPAFIMNRWKNHWIYWLGPILGAIIAGFLYEFIFNQTRKSSLCYRPKLFRLSAQDMAKVGSRSRLHRNQQKLAHTFQPSPTNYRPHLHNHHQSTRQSPLSRAQASYLINNGSLLKASRDPRFIATSTSATHLQAPHPFNNSFDHTSYPHQQERQQVLQHPQAANFDRCKSTAILNSVVPKQHRSNTNILQGTCNMDPGKSTADVRFNSALLDVTKLSFSEL